jgi:hypothetical protein
MGLELGSCEGIGREVDVDDGVPSNEDPLQVTEFVNATYIYRDIVGSLDAHNDSSF